MAQCRGADCKFGVGRVSLVSQEDFSRDLECLLHRPVSAVYVLQCQSSAFGSSRVCTRKKFQGPYGGGGAGAPFGSHLGRWDADLEVASPVGWAKGEPYMGCQVREAWINTVGMWLRHFRAEVAGLTVVVALDYVVRWRSPRNESASTGLNDEGFLARHNMSLAFFGLGILMLWHIVNGSGLHTKTVLDDYIAEFAVLTAFVLMNYVKEPGLQIAFSLMVLVLWTLEWFVDMDHFDFVPNEFVPSFGWGIFIALLLRTACLGLSWHIHTNLQHAAIPIKELREHMGTGHVLLLGGICPYMVVITN